MRLRSMVAPSPPLAAALGRRRSAEPGLSRMVEVRALARGPVLEEISGGSAAGQGVGLAPIDLVRVNADERLTVHPSGVRIAVSGTGA